MKNIFLILGVVIMSTSFNACGGNSSPSEDSLESSLEETNSSISREEQFQKIGIETNCTVPVSISDYMEIVKGDQIEESIQNSVIKIYHDENNLKKVCLVLGKAFVLRVLE